MHDTTHSPMQHKKLGEMGQNLSDKIKMLNQFKSIIGNQVSTYYK